MRAKEIQEDDEFWDGDLLVWIALGNANPITIEKEKLVAIPIKYMQDGGRDYRYFEPDQIVKVRRSDSADDVAP